MQTSYQITVIVSDIDWFVDINEIQDLPKEIEIVFLTNNPNQVAYLDYLSEFLSHEFGFCHYGFSVSETECIIVAGNEYFNIVDYTDLTVRK